MQKDKGILKAWKDDKGFGFIKPDTGGADVFVHIRDFGAIARKPRVGDVIFYQSVRDGSGKYRAADVEIEGLPRFTKPLTSGNKPGFKTEKKTAPRYDLIALFIAIAVLATVAYNEFTEPGSVIEMPAGVPLVNSKNTPEYKCEGKTHCSQMTSCAEATYYINHCPNTEMDGNNDGVPCESQWCK